MISISITIDIIYTCVCVCVCMCRGARRVKVTVVGNRHAIQVQNLDKAVCISNNANAWMLKYGYIFEPTEFFGLMKGFRGCDEL